MSKGRSTFAELAAQVGLTAPTVHDRVKKLERSGIIEGYTAIINSSSLGYEITAMVSITTEARDSSEYERRLTDISEIQQCFSVAGEETYIAFLLTKSPKTLEKVLERIRNISGTRSIKASVVLSAPISRHTLPQEDDVREFPAESNKTSVAR